MERFAGEYVAERNGAGGFVPGRRAAWCGVMETGRGIGREGRLATGSFTQTTRRFTTSSSEARPLDHRWGFACVR